LQFFNRSFCLFLLLFGLGYPGRLLAQIELSNFTATGRAGISTTLATDYQAQGVNPANLAIAPTFDGMNNTVGLGELGFSVYSDALSKLNLRSALFDPERQLTQAEKRQAARDFANRGLTINLDFLYGGYAWQKVSGGSGFALTVRERAQWYSKFSPLASEILFKGLNAEISVDGLVKPYFDSLVTKVRFDSVNNTFQIDTLGALALVPRTLSDILNGTRISMAWNREYGFAYGVNLVNGHDLKLNLGVGLKYIQGISYLDVQSDGKTLTAFIAASPYLGVRFGQIFRFARTTDSVNVGFLPNAAGRGLGFEFGFNAIIKDHYRLAASLTDMGTVDYQTNVYVASDTLLTNISTQGFSNFDFFQNAQQFDGFQRDLIQWKGLQNRRQSLPTKVNLGFALSYERWSAGLEAVIPLNDVAGNFNRPIFSLGGDFKPRDWLRLGSGVLMGGNYTNVLVPFGITFITSNGLWEMGIASRDVLTYVRQKKPMLSLSTGLLRFRF
jgi:Family of unknown function (DUF5723)